MLLASVALALFLMTMSTQSLCGQDANQRNNYKPQVGKLHPEFVMPSIADDKPIKLSDFKGKKVLLINFASW